MALIFFFGCYSLTRLKKSSAAFGCGADTRGRHGGGLQMSALYSLPAPKKIPVEYVIKISLGNRNPLFLRKY
jgi:hypothetical protein